MDDKIIFSFSPLAMTCLSSYLELSEMAFADGDFRLEWGSLRGRLCGSLRLETGFPSVGDLGLPWSLTWWPSFPAVDLMAHLQAWVRGAAGCRVNKLALELVN